MTQQIAAMKVGTDASGTWPMAVASTGAVTFDLQSAIQAARLGDDSAFATLVAQYQSTAQRVAQHILRTEEAAADAVQDALIKAHRAMPRFQEGNFRSWLLRIVTNTCYDHLRRQKRRPAVSLDEMMESSNVEFADDESYIDPERAVLHREQRDLLLSAIDDLSPWHREVVMLVDVQGYDYGEAAEILDVPLGTVKSRLSRARACLRDRLLESNLLALPKEKPEKQ
ncbi:MAG: sigma-70 family RNA polymerase sigma factor [Caldilineaceae bacterium]|nr:sigma-70 family RNA polymerase sigma factor [Caldilineaceae bacterium]